jgi:hypothetical protein
VLPAGKVDAVKYEASQVAMTFYPEQQREAQYGAVACLLFALFLLMTGHPIAMAIGGVSLLAATVVVAGVMTRYPRLVLSNGVLEYQSLAQLLLAAPRSHLDLARLGPAHIVQRRFGRYARKVTFLSFRPIEDHEVLDPADVSKPPDGFDRGLLIPLDALIGNDLAAAQGIADVVNANRPTISPVLDPAEREPHRRNVARRRAILQGLYWLILLVILGVWLWLKFGP